MKTKIADPNYLSSDQLIAMTSFEWNGMVIDVKERLTMTEMLEFVAKVVSMCFDDSGEYMPEILDYAVQSNIVEMYTDMVMPDDLEAQYDMLVRTNISSLITEHIDTIQFREMIKAIDRKLKYVSESNSEKIRADVERLFGMFDQLQESVGQAIQSITGSDIAKISSAIQDGRFSVESLVKAYSNMIRDEEMTADGNQS